MTAFRASSSVLLALAALSLAGCGTSSTGRCPVQGAVSYGGEPVDDGGIAFIPEGGGEMPLRATGEIHDGRYDLDSSRGPYPGKYRVEIYWFKKTGRTLTSPSGKATREETRQAIPPKYNEKTQLEVEIKPGHNTRNFDLPS